MNKAFVREPDQTAEHCPRCGSLGQPVGRETLDAQIAPAARGQLADAAAFCPYPQCDVAYFDQLERAIVAIDELVHTVYPKDPDAPICGCFGFTRDEIEQDIAEGTVTHVKALLAKAQSDAARCRSHAANGQSCVPEVQRYYMKHRGGSG